MSMKTFEKTKKSSGLIAYPKDSEYYALPRIKRKIKPHNSLETYLEA